jgi:hypothetical protein
MSDTNQHEVAESLLERNQRREMEINEALKLEAERHAAAVRNMHRLRALRSRYKIKRRIAARVKTS